MAELPRPESFPLSAATVPLEETKAADFLRANPTFDGRGITVGILDTGVDPGAIGLQRTSDGQPKLIDIIDCTGSGDVDMKHEVVADADGHLTGLSGRTLTVPAEWQRRNPSGKYRLGVKRAFELYPSGLRKRVKAERRRDFDERQRALQVALQRAKDRLDGGKADGGKEAATSGGNAIAGADEAEVDTLLAQISGLQKDYDDPGPTFDCLAFIDGDGDGGSGDGNWVGAIDTTETGHFGYGMAQSNPALTMGKTPTVAPVPLMSAYGVSQQYASFGAFEQLNYGLQFYFDDSGDVLSIVVDSGAHGTHVAGITAAYHPDCVEQNGVAPGAQLVSLKIGDSRLDGMETGAGLARALIEARRLGLDAINMSFGEPGAVADRGRFVELARELVRDDGVIFVSSAGNNGPALSSVGSPGGTSDCCISVGAYVSQQMMAAQYSVRRAGRPAEQLYNWSSVGPTCDGALGVEICAPGGAIAPVPNWTLNRHQLMNGTSMSSPNATGCIALLLSALKQCGSAATGLYGDRPWTPYSVRRALQATCRAPVGETVGARGLEPFVYGGGLVQIDAAYEHHLAHFTAQGNGEGDSAERMAMPIAYDTILHARHDGCADGKGSRGCYLRQPEEVATPSQHLVSITPAFHRDEPSANKVRFERAVTLQATAPWLSCPAHVLIMQQGRGFTVVVDPRGLAPGVHYGEVRGLDSSNLEAGALFEVPFTVVKHEAWSADGAASGGGEVAAHTHTYDVKRFVPGERDRHFLAVPAGATWCDVTIEGAGGVAGAGGGSGLAIDNQLSADGAAALPVSPPPPPAATEGGGAYGDAFAADAGAEGSVVATSDADADNDSRMMLLHCVQNRAQVQSARNEGFKRYIRVRPGSSHTFSFCVDGGLCLEVCLAQWWQTAGSALCRMRVAFHGVQADGSGSLAIAGGDGYQRVVLRAPLRPTTLRPSAKLTSWRQRVRPSSWTLRALGTRDTLPRGRQVHEIVLTYEFTQKEKGEVTPRLPLLNGALYESAFEGQMYHVYGDSKKLLSIGECWPGSDNGPIKVPKAPASSAGKFTIRWQLRHESRELLERYKDAVVLLERKLGSAVPLKFLASRGQIATGEGRFSDLVLTPGASVAVFLAEPLDLKPPTGASAGDELIGTVTWAKPAGDLAAGAGHAPGGFPVRYVLPPPAPEAPAKKAKKKVAAKPKTLSEKTRDLHLEALVALEGKSPTKEDAAPAGGGEAAPSELDIAAAAYDTLYATLAASFPRHLPLLRSKLRHTAALVRGGGGDSALTTADVVAAAETVLAEIDTAALAAFFGARKQDADWSDLGSAGDDSESQKQANERAEKVKQKQAVVEALAFKAAALETAASASAAPGDATPELLAAWRQLQEWADVSEPRFAKLALAMLKRGSGGSPRRGHLLKRLAALVDVAPSSLTPASNPLGLSLSHEEVVLMRIAVLEELGWDHWAAHYRAWRVVDAPASLALF